MSAHLRRTPSSKRGPRLATAAALARYEAELDEIVNAYLPARMPDVLYHYTTWSAFRAIVLSQRFHARAHHCTNDPAELTSLDDTLIEIATDLVRLVATPLRRPLIAFLNDLRERNIANVATAYLACFSVAKDKPSQWHAYADNGKGVCLAFKVLHHEKPPSTRMASLPVIYDQDVWRATVRDQFSRVIACHSRFGRRYHHGYSAGESSAWSALMRIAATASLSSKKQAWSSEEEWRTIVLDARDDYTPLFKPDGSEYIELQLREAPRRFAFDEILLGPRQELGLPDAIDAAYGVLKDAGYTAEEMPPIKLSTAELSE